MKDSVFELDRHGGVGVSLGELVEVNSTLVAAARAILRDVV
ncbi:MAG TPA: hypothetical protein VF747_10245 [Blastocatellia bacterium]